MLTECHRVHTISTRIIYNMLFSRDRSAPRNSQRQPAIAKRIPRRFFDGLGRREPFDCITSSAVDTRRDDPSDRATARDEADSITPLALGSIRISAVIYRAAASPLRTRSPLFRVDSNTRNTIDQYEFMTRQPSG